MSLSVAALLVTSNSQRWIGRTLETIVGQDRPADAVVVIDDNSTDDTRRIIHDVLGGRATVVRATSRAGDTTTRIAHNFHQGIRACADHEVVVLGDHDDLWHPGRIAHQVRLLADDPTAQMVASDGRLVDALDVAVGGTLRSTFPVPDGWSTLAAADQVAYAVRHSIATGGASALRPTAFADLSIPAGWLHDRWWSLVATVRGGMRLDDAVVIDYRVSDTQEVGLSRGRQDHSTARRVARAAQDAPEVLAKLGDIATRLRPLAADPQARRALAWPHLLRALR